MTDRPLPAPPADALIARQDQDEDLRANGAKEPTPEEPRSRSPQPSDDRIDAIRNVSVLLEGMLAARVEYAIESRSKVKALAIQWFDNWQTERTMHAAWEKRAYQAERAAADQLTAQAARLRALEESGVSDESVQIVHLRLCRRAEELKRPIAALEEAAEEIAELEAQIAQLNRLVSIAADKAAQAKETARPSGAERPKKDAVRIRSRQLRVFKKGEC